MASLKVKKYIQNLSRFNLLGALTIKKAFFYFHSIFNSKQLSSKPKLLEFSKITY